ncbi:DUF1351 domain-containing protein [Leuconostoc sp. LN180020]|uniref:DUF1351 domain-containing protein n=1 Tax=Leuconostoc sp. LN180020 TaxID=2571156 RepID=UPI00178087A3|nr:DUF1351 domain-containing protein [Leuconostoc sp. LN180020]QOG09367.1 DUF1351 domain-containing protein [Leuconostoc sp. LN180020]
MANELAQPKVDVKDGQINFKNVDQFKSDFEQIIQRNSNFIVTDETLTGSKKARAELRNAAKESASWRSKIKAELLKPFDEVAEIAISFEKKAKSAADAIDSDVKVFDEAEKQKRLDGLKNYIDARAKELGIETITEFNDKHLIKGNFNGTKPKQKFIDEFIEPELARLVSEKELKIANIAAVRNYAESKGFDPEGYIHSLDFKTLAQIMGDIDGDVERKKKREEAEKAIAEMEAQKEQERLERAKSAGDKKVDEETGEIIQNPQPVVEKTYNRTLYIIEATSAELNQLANYMKSNGIAFRGEK